MNKTFLLLSADKVTQFTNALATPDVADPLQVLCDEAAALVQRMTTGFVIDALSAQQWTRAVALYGAYSKTGPVPPDIQKDFDAATKELEAIAKGDRPNLPKVVTASQTIIGGSWGSGVSTGGRMSS